MFQNSKYSVWLQNWLKVYKKPYVKNWKGIKRNIELHIPLYVLNTKMCNLNAFIIQKALDSVKSSRMRLDVYDIYHSSLFYAFKLGIISSDISSLLIKPKHIRVIGSALTSSELKLFLQNISFHSLEYYFKFCLFTGCRRSEALSVRWSDISVCYNRIHICGTKTLSSDRFIPISFMLSDLLRHIPYRGEKLFYFNKDYVTRVFKRFCSKHKLHDLRHTFATICLQKGVNIKVLQSWLGHSSISMTLNIYSHVLRDFENDEIKKFTLF